MICFFGSYKGNLFRLQYILFFILFFIYKIQEERLIFPATATVLTINVSIVYMGPDVVIWMRATSLMRGVIRGGH